MESDELFSTVAAGVAISFVCNVLGEEVLSTGAIGVAISCVGNVLGDDVGEASIRTGEGVLNSPTVLDPKDGDDSSVLDAKNCSLAGDDVVAPESWPSDENVGVAVLPAESSVFDCVPDDEEGSVEFNTKVTINTYIFGFQIIFTLFPQQNLQ